VLQRGRAGQTAFHMHETGTSGRRMNKNERETGITKDFASRNMRANIRQCASDGSQRHLDTGARDSGRGCKTSLISVVDPRNFANSEGPEQRQHGIAAQKQKKRDRKNQNGVLPNPEQL